MSKKEEALAKLQPAEVKGQKSRAVAGGVANALKLFISQSDEFAQAVADGGSLQECCDAVVKGCGSVLSDEEAYGKAAQFYFPGAGVKFKMEINLCASVETEDAAAPAQEEKQNSIVIDLLDLLG